MEATAYSEPPSKRRKRSHDEPSVLDLGESGLSVDLFSEVIAQCRSLMGTRAVDYSRHTGDIATSMVDGMRGHNASDDVRQSAMEASLVPVFLKMVPSSTNEAMRYDNGQFIVDLDNGEQALIAVLSTQNGAGKPFSNWKQQYNDFWESQQTAVARQSNTPCLFLDIIATDVFVGGAVLIDGHLVAQQLVPPANFFDNYSLTESTMELFADCLSKLHAYYKRHSTAQQPETFPRVLSWPASNHGPSGQFSYLSRLGNSGASSCTFLANRLDGANLVIKFTRTYSAAAHDILAREHLAPALYYCGPCDIDDILLVVMEYVPAIPLSDIAAGIVTTDDHDFAAALEDVRRAIALLHGAGLAYGDLRMPNILVHRDDPGPVRTMDAASLSRQSGCNNGGESSQIGISHASHSPWRASLVDFDWCGPDGQACYPLRVNLGGDIDWHEGVRRRGPILMEHDIYRLERLAEEMEFHLGSIDGSR